MRVVAVVAAASGGSGNDDAASSAAADDDADAAGRTDSPAGSSSAAADVVGTSTESAPTVATRQFDTAAATQFNALGVDEIIGSLNEFNPVRYGLPPLDAKRDRCKKQFESFSDLFGSHEIASLQ
jgi:hypothetical protein